jgi:hypothetical protein
MKVAVLSESAADEAAVVILLEGILGQTAAPERIPIRARGWPAVLNQLPPTMKHLQYRTDVLGLAVIADSNRSPAHRTEH